MRAFLLTLAMTAFASAAFADEAGGAATVPADAASINDALSIQLSDPPAAGAAETAAPPAASSTPAAPAVSEAKAESAPSSSGIDPETHYEPMGMRIGLALVHGEADRGVGLERTTGLGVEFEGRFSFMGPKLSRRGFVFGDQFGAIFRGTLPVAGDDEFAGIDATAGLHARVMAGFMMGGALSNDVEFLLRFGVLWDRVGYREANRGWPFYCYAGGRYKMLSFEAGGGLRHLYGMVGTLYGAFALRVEHTWIDSNYLASSTVTSLVFGI